MHESTAASVPGAAAPFRPAPYPEYQPRTGDIPTEPGVYRFRDQRGAVIYVGKAKSLRARLTSYFQDLSVLHPRTRAMVTSAFSVDWVVVRTEVEALQLEWQWIKEFDPRYNVRFRDDKSYPWFAVTLNEEFPRALVMRGERRKGIRYFGPYVQAWAIRESLDLLLRVFPVRTCSNPVFRRAAMQGRPCLLGYIEKCSAPCVGRISAEDHRAIVMDLCAFMDGDTSSTLRTLREQMSEAALAERYEAAARLRDDLAALEGVLGKHAVVLNEGVDADLIALAEDELQAAVQVFHVRGGRIRGQRAFVLERPLESTSGELMVQVCERLYGAELGEAIPKSVLVSTEPSDVEALESWLADRRGTAVEVRVPQRGDKRTLLTTVEQNAKQTLVRSKLTRATDITSRSRALAELQEALDLDEAPLRIECIDVSHFQGDDVVASLVVFEDGLPRKADYRRFVLRHGRGNDDVASIAEVVTRRFSHVDEDGSHRTFRYEPGLLVIDGGRPQVESAAAALAAIGRADIAVVGLAKRLEEIWLPGDENPIILSRSSEALYLMQRARDEAHRFALRHQVARRTKRSVASQLDAVPGLGASRKKQLLTAFKSVKRIRAASDDELLALPGFGPALVASLRTALAKPTDVAPAFDAESGEILDDGPNE